MLPVLLTPQQAAELLGVGASTVRRWCDSGMLATSRTTGGHRRIDRQLLMDFARKQKLELVDQASVATAGRGGRLADEAQLSERFYELLVHGDEREARQFVIGLVERRGQATSLCDAVIAPAMHRLGTAWSEGRVPVFREHMATEIAQSAIHSARSHLPSRSDAPVAVCAALAGDPYSMGPSMCSLVLRSSGFRTVLLGVDTPTSELLPAATELCASLVAISINAAPRSTEELAELCLQAGELGLRVALGGRELSPELRRKLRPDFFGDTMGHLESYARRLLEQGSLVPSA